MKCNIYLFKCIIPIILNIRNTYNIVIIQLIQFNCTYSIRLSLSVVSTFVQIGTFLLKNCTFILFTFLVYTLYPPIFPQTTSKINEHVSFSPPYIHPPALRILKTTLSTRTRMWIARRRERRKKESARERRREGKKDGEGTKRKGRGRKWKSIRGRLNPKHSRHVPSNRNSSDGREGHKYGRVVAHLLWQKNGTVRKRRRETRNHSNRRELTAGRVIFPGSKAPENFKTPPPPSTPCVRLPVAPLYNLLLLLLPPSYLFPPSFLPTLYPRSRQ